MKKESEIKIGNLIYIFDNINFKNFSIVEKLWAIKHNDMVEFIFKPVDKNEKFLNRSLSFVYSKKKYEACFDEPSPIFVKFAKKFITVKKTESYEYNQLYTHLRQYRDFYRMKSGEMKDSAQKKFFENKVPTNFFIKGKIENNNELVDLCKNLNFFMIYYDRKTPIINIESEIEKKEKFKETCLSENYKFPKNISIKKINPVLLDIFDAAISASSPFLQYLFYFQILEYCSYYHLNNDLKNKIKKILYNPDNDGKVSDTIKFIIEDSRDYLKNSTDSQRIGKIINDYCDFNDIKQEIKDNWEYYSKDNVFDGNFILKSIINNKDELEIPPKNIVDNIKNNIEKLRNAIVHSKETKENKTIFPTQKNYNLIKPYIFLIRRIAEKISIQFD